MTFSRRTLVVVLVSAATVLSGCGGDDAADEMAERLVEDRLGDGVDVDLDGDDGSFELTTDEGSVKGSADGSLPDGFPDDIPLPEWKLVHSMTMDTTGVEGSTYTLSYETDAAADAAIEELTGLYEGAGYTKRFSSTSGAESGIVALSNDRWTINATAGPDGDVLSVQLIIAPTPAA